MVVVVKPLREGTAALLVGAVEARVGPFREEGLDEPLGFAVGLRAVGSSDLVADPKGLGRSAELSGEAIGHGPVGHHPLNAYPLLPEEGGRGEHEPGSGGTAGIGQDLGEGQAGRIVDGDVDDLEARAAVFGRRAAAEEAVPASRGNPRQRLHIDMEELPGVLPDIADGDAGRAVQRAQPRDPMATEDGIDRGVGAADQGRDAARSGLQALAETEDLACRALRNQTRRGVRTTRSIPQPVQSLLLPPTKPFVRGLPRYTGRSSRLAHGPMQVLDALDQQQTAKGREFAVWMSHDCLRGWSYPSRPHTSAKRQSCVNNLFGQYI